MAKKIVHMKLVKTDKKPGIEKHTQENLKDYHSLC